MGEYAEYALAQAMRYGTPVPKGPVKRRPLVPCPICGEEKRGIRGVMDHQNRKHGAKWSNGKILSWKDPDEGSVDLANPPTKHEARDA